MKRRTFIQTLANAIFLPFVGKPALQQAGPPAFTDSDGRTPAQLASLHDAQTQTGGVAYQP